MRLNGENHIDVYLQSEEVQVEETLMIVSFGIQDDDKGRNHGQLRDRTLFGLRQLLWELWQDEVEQFGVMQVFEATPQPLEELGLQQALVIVVTLDGVRRQNGRLMQPTLNFIHSLEEAFPREPSTKFIQTPISHDDLLMTQEEHEECEPFGMKPCTILHAGDRVLLNRQCHVRAGGVTKLLISPLPREFQRVQESVRGFEDFVRHVRQESRRHGQRVTFVIHAANQETIHAESLDLSLLQPDVILNHVRLGPIISQGELHYLADSEIYKASGLPGWCYHFLHVANAQVGRIEVVAILRIVDTHGAIMQPEWGVFCFQSNWPLPVLREQLREFFALGRDEDFRIMHRYRDVICSSVLSNGDTIIVRVQRSEQSRSRARSRSRGFEQDETQFDDSSLLQFQRAHETKPKMFHDNHSPSSTGKVLILLENHIEERPSRVALELYDKLWPERHYNDVEGNEAEPCIVSLRKALKRVTSGQWQGFNTRFEDIPDLHPSAEAAIHWNGVGKITPLLHVYTDGSAKQGEASWAFVVLNQVGTSHQCVGYAAGLVDDAIGPCEGTSNDAEATAMIAVAEFVLSLGTFVQEVHCHFDALAIGRGASGQQAIVTKHDKLSVRQEAARIMFSLLQSTVNVVMHHVHAHVGNPFNECADSLANAVRKGWTCPEQAALRSRELLHHPLRKWAWIEIAPTAMLPSLQNMQHHPMQTRTETAPDSVLTVNPDISEETVRASLRIATANVATMHYNKGSEGCMSDKANELAHQFHAAKYDVVAFQETRASVSGVRYLGSWLRVISASVKGHGGVEIWLNTESDFFRAMSIKIDAQDVLVWHQDDRILALQVQWPGGGLNFITLYAPQSGSAQDQIRQWWKDFDQIIVKKPSHSPIIILGDCNGRVGSVSSENVGDHAADIEDEAGTLFRQMCEKHDWIVPSTHAMFHVGQSDTFIAPRGHRSRLDYIAVSADCSNGIDKSWVDQEIDLLNRDADHRVVALHFPLPCG